NTARTSTSPRSLHDALPISGPRPGARTTCWPTSEATIVPKRSVSPATPNCLPSSLWSNFSTSPLAQGSKMQLEYMPPSLAGWAEIAATPTDFDAYPPVPKLRVKWPLGEANVDRTAVAASLIFAPWIAGRCDHIRQFSALTEQRLVEWFQG